MKSVHRILLTIIGITLIYLTVGYIGSDNVCHEAYGSVCGFRVEAILEIMLQILPAGLISLFLLRSRVLLISHWIKFSIVWAIVTMPIIALIPEYGGVGIVSIDRGAVSFVLSALYLVISIILIIYKSWKLRKA